MSEDRTSTARSVVESFNAADWDAYAAAHTPGAVYDEAGTSRRIEGIGEIISLLKGWRTGMPDVAGTVKRAFTAGDSVVLEVTWQGTHTGPLPCPAVAIEATGKSQTTRAAWVFDFDGEAIKESRHYFDMLSFMQQIGQLPQ